MGFIDAPLIGPANMASNKTTLPIANPANIPCSFEPVATFKITNIKKKLRMISNKKDCMASPDGNVDPNTMEDGNKNFRIYIAAKAPIA